MPKSRYAIELLIFLVLFAIVAVAFATKDTLAKEDDGEIAFNNACRTCHSAKAGDNRLGPHLHGVVGRKAGAVDGFNYSATLKGGSLVWDEATLDKFIANPEAVAPGNAMKPFTGIADEKQRAAIITFLKQAG